VGWEAHDVGLPVYLCSGFSQDIAPPGSLYPYTYAGEQVQAALVHLGAFFLG
jgi:hypothetical protein